MHHDIEIQEWLDALSSLVKHAGKEKAAEVLSQLSKHATTEGLETPAAIRTAYINSIPVEQENTAFWQCRTGQENPFLGALECHGHGHEGQR